jgi:regulation of enolase protein 1 (concanavalin A-like superfamily)
MMTEMIDVPGLPFATTASHPDVWAWHPDRAALVAAAPGRTDFYVNPGGPEAGDAESLHNAATLLGVPPPGDFLLSATVSVDFRSQYDAGVLMLWIDERNWAKFCFEFSPAARPMVVSVVTRGTSDDANAFTVDGRSVRLRIARVGRVYAFHASTDERTWELIRVFTLGDDLAEHRVGFEAQSPTGDGCTVTFDQIAFTGVRLQDLRDGS